MRKTPIGWALARVEVQGLRDRSVMPVTEFVTKPKIHTIHSSIIHHHRIDEDDDEEENFY